MLTSPACRNSKGQFVKGNRASKQTLAETESVMRIGDLRKALMKSVTVEDVKKVMDAMQDIALNDKDSRVRLTAQVEYLNRIFGKPKEMITMDVNNNQLAPVLVDKLSPQQIELLEQICESTEAEVIDVEVLEDKKESNEIKPTQPNEVVIPANDGKE